LEQLRKLQEKLRNRKRGDAPGDAQNISAAEWGKLPNVLKAILPALAIAVG